MYYIKERDFRTALKEAEFDCNLSLLTTVELTLSEKRQSFEKTEDDFRNASILSSAGPEERSPTNSPPCDLLTYASTLLVSSLVTLQISIIFSFGESEASFRRV